MSLPDSQEASTHNFVHLHVHSEYSMMDGTITIKDLIARTKEMGHSHVALTDHGNMHGAIEFYLEAKKAGLIPILGIELYHAGEAISFLRSRGFSEIDDLLQNSDFHLVCLARNDQGYKNLIKLSSSGYKGTSLKEIPVTPEKDLDDYSSNLVGMSSCLKGEFAYLVSLLRKVSGLGELIFDPQHPQVGLICQALELHARKMEDRFGQGNYYVELINNKLHDQEKLLPDLVFVARHLGLPIVASADAHYLDKDFAETHALAIAIKNSLTMNDIKERQRTSQFHLTTNQEMADLFSKWPEALQNTLEVAEKCSQVTIKMDTYYLPKIDFGRGETPAQALDRLAKEGLEERHKEVETLTGNQVDLETRKHYSKRLQYELGVILQMGFPDYFLIVYDFIKWAKVQKIPVGPGRGSGAGSLVAYSLRITNLDPIPYHLIFERFLNPERVSMPDFDIDFCQWRREEVIQYCVEKYGSQQVAQITTFGKMQAKGAVKSVGRALNVSYNKVDRFTKLFPPELGLTLTDALEKEPRLQQEMDRDDLLQECMDQALKLEGLVSHTSVHAAGVVISDGPMTDYVPVYTTDGKSYITQYEMKPTEKVGLVKFDFLGLKTLTVIDEAVSLVRQDRQKDFQIDKIPMDDPKVFDLMSRGYTCGLFQCESMGMTQLITKLMPSKFEDIIALVALFRPGPLGSGMVDDFIERKHGRQKIVHLHPLLEPILEDTYGMILYQEQVQKIAATLAHYSLGEADLLRRAMGKKIPEEMAKQKDRFLTGASKNNIDLKLSEEIFDLMAEFAKYGFNKSHSAAYGLVTYQTAYLKAHFPEQFLAASMTCDLDNTDKLKRYIEECYRFGFKVLPPDLNRSSLAFDAPSSKSVGYGLQAIKGVGEGGLKLITEARQKGGSFRTLSDLAKRVDLSRVTKKTMQILTQVGALDFLKIPRKTIEGFIPDLVSFSQGHHEAQKKGQRSLFDFDQDSSVTHDEEPKGEDCPWQEYQVEEGLETALWDNEDLATEKKLLGVFLTAHPMDLYKTDSQFFSQMTIKDMNAISASKSKIEKWEKKDVATVALFANHNLRRTKKGTLMASIRLEQSKEEKLEAVMFEKEWNQNQLPPSNVPILVEGRLSKSFDGSSLRYQLSSMKPLDEIRQKRVRQITIHIDGQGVPSPISERVRSLREVIGGYPGKIKVSFKLLFSKGSEVMISSEEGFSVDLSSEFLAAIKKLPMRNLFISYR